MTVACITALCAEVDAPLGALPPPREAHLWPSAVVTLGLLQARTGVGTRPCSRWLPRDARALCPPLPERPRLLRRCRTPQDWTQGFLAAPTGLGVIAPSGLEVRHPRRAGRSPHQMGRQGLSHHRWMGGGKLCLVVHQWGLVVGGAWATAPGAAHTLPGLRQQGDGRRLVLRDTGCQAAAGAPRNLPRCPRGAWQARRLVETVFALLPLVAGSGGESPLASSPQHWTCTFPGIPRTPLKGRVTDPSALLYPAGGTRRQRRRGPGGAGRTRGTRPPPWASPALPMLP